jgi:hypothetical protein
MKIQFNTWTCLLTHNGGEQKRFSVKLSPSGRFLLTGGRKERRQQDGVGDIRELTYASHLARRTGSRYILFESVAASTPSSYSVCSVSFLHSSDIN